MLLSKAADTTISHLVFTTQDDHTILKGKMLLLSSYFMYGYDSFPQYVIIRVHVSVSSRYYNAKGRERNDSPRWLNSEKK